MHRTLPRGSRPDHARRPRFWPAVAVAVLLASPLAIVLVSDRGGSNAIASYGTNEPLPEPSALLTELYVPAAYSEAGYRLAGAVPSHRTLPAQLPIVVTLGFANASELIRVLASLSDPSSPAYHHYLTASQFDAAFGPAPATYAGAVAYFQALGASDLRTYADRVTISFDASPAVADRMFHTQVEEWSFAGRVYYAPASPVELPTRLAAAISAVVGLSSYSIASTSLGSRVVPPAPSHRAVAGVSAATPAGYLPPAEVGGAQLQYGPDLQAAYDELSLFQQDGYPTDAVIATILWQGYYNGSTPITTPFGTLHPGQAVGPFVPSDISAYFNETVPIGQPHAVAVGVPVGGALPAGPLASYDTTGANTENTLDLEMAGSLAPGATVYDVYGTSPSFPQLDTAFAFILNPNASAPGLAQVSVISNSWGDQDGLHPEWNQYTQEAAARGITVLASSGDSGDYPNSPWQSGNPPDVNTTFPSSLATDTYGVVAVGGTAITLNSGTLQINSTRVWNVPAEQIGTTSGISPFYAEPSWQLASSANTLIGGAGRGVPDIAAIATNALVTITYIGYRYNATNASLYGRGYSDLYGTSVACPVEAGVIAEIDHVLEAQRNPWLGFMLPGLYQLADQQYGPLVTTPQIGIVNGSAYTSPLPTLPLSDTVNGSNHHYAARLGYDLVTGWGSLDAYNYTMYFLSVASAGVNGRLSAVENNFTLDGLSVTSYGTGSFFNASIQQNLLLANSLGAPIYWIQNVIYINRTAAGWAMNYTGWVVYPFYGLYYSLQLYEYNYPLVGQIVPLPARFDMRTVLLPGAGFNNQSVEYFVGAHELSLPVPGASYIIGSLWYNYSWQGIEYENGPFPGNPIPGGLSPQFGLVGGPSGGRGEFGAPTAGSMQAQVQPYGSSTFEIAQTRSYYESIDQTGEDAQNLAWTAGAPGSWTLGVSPGSALQGVLSYQPALQYRANFTVLGLPAGTLWYINISDGGTYSSTNATISIPLPSGTFAYNVSVASPFWEPFVKNGTITIAGSSQRIDVAVQHLPWAAMFSQTGLPSGIVWSVELGGGRSVSTLFSNLTIQLANGSYPYRVNSSDSGWAPVPAAGVLVVAGAPTTLPVAFIRVEYTVSFDATGLPAGTPWFVNISGGANYTSTATQISFVAPNGTYLFHVGTAAPYQATPSSGSAAVSGSNISKSIHFSAPGPPSAAVSLGSAAAVALAAVAVAGLLVGAWALRRSRQRPPAA